MSGNLDDLVGLGADLVDWNWSDLCHSLGDHFFHPNHSPGPVYGTPEVDRHDWLPQTTPFTCAVVAQEMVLHDFGINASEAQLTYEAASHGWLTDGGTPIQDMADLLDVHGVPAHERYGGSVSDLAQELARGHEVIIPVDSGDLWHTDLWHDLGFKPHGADHAVVLTGLDMRDPNHPKAIINDPGDPDGAGKDYPLDQFLEAWSHSDGCYVATDYAPSGLAHDPTLGTHFDSAAGMYLNTGFWEDFLLNLARTAGVELLRESGLPWPHGDLDGSLGSHPLSAMTEEQRNDLLLRI